jgi:hypothetical protein
MVIFKENPVCRLCSEKEETIFHIVFECEVLARRRFNLLGLLNPGEEIPKRNLVNRLLDLINLLQSYLGKGLAIPLVGIKYSTISTNLLKHSNIRKGE